MRKAVLAVILVVAFASSPSLAADLVGGPVPAPYCARAVNSPLLRIRSNAELEKAIVDRMDESVYVTESPAWIGSSRPAFVWATEAKLACGKAYGYLKSNYRDDENINKCDCFYSRMHEYMY